MTPNAIEILIHCHVSPTPHPRKSAPAVAEELRSLEANGLIEPLEAGAYRTTARGAAHIEQLCQTPWPVLAWLDAHGNPIRPQQ